MTRPDPLLLAQFSRWLDVISAQDFATLDAPLDEAEEWAVDIVAEVVLHLMRQEGWSRGAVLGLMEGVLDGLLQHWATEGWTPQEPEPQTWPPGDEAPR